MESVSSSTQLLYQERPIQRAADMETLVSWVSVLVRRHWLIPATMVALLAAVAAPGGLQSEFVRYIPLSYIYFCAGGRHWCRHADGQWRHLLVSVLHSQVLAPAATAAVLAACKGTVDHRIARGLVLTSLGAPCGWLSLAAAPCNSPSPLLALLGTQLAALLAAPLTMIIICGRASVPPVGSELRALLLAIPPYAFGMISISNNNITTKSINNITAKLNKLLKSLHHLPTKHTTKTSSENSNNLSTNHYTTNCLIAKTNQHSESTAVDATASSKHYATGNDKIVVGLSASDENFETTTLTNISIEQFSTAAHVTSSTTSTNNVVKLSVTLLLYWEFSERLSEAEGSLLVGDVLGTMALVTCCVTASVTLCLAYQWLGITSASGTRIVACVALPRCLDVGWQSSTRCVSWGLSRLPAVFAAPLQTIAVHVANAALRGDDKDMYR